LQKIVRRIMVKKDGVIADRFSVFIRITTAVMLFMLFFFYPSAAYLQQGDDVLQEIEKHIRSDYIYLVDGGQVPLSSMEQLKVMLNDPYSGYYDSNALEAFDADLERKLLDGIGIYLKQDGRQFFVTALIPGSPAEKAGIRNGDRILYVDRVDVSSLTEEGVLALIRGNVGTQVELVIYREGKTMTFKMVREKLSLPLVECFWVEEGIGLLCIYSFGSGLAEKAVQQLERLEVGGMRGLMIDLRHNHGGYVEEALDLSAVFTDGVLMNYKDKKTTWAWKGEDSHKYKDKETAIPIVVLVNEWTASSGEILTAALKENGVALIVGKTTYGKGMMQMLYPLSDGGGLMLSIAEFSTPQGRKIEKKGVEPHFLVTKANEQFYAARDLMRLLIAAEEGKGGLFEPLKINSQNYYSLRGLLRQTGRGIAAGSAPGVFYFYWNQDLYCLDLHEKVISWTDHKGVYFRHQIYMHQGSAYVREDFLTKGLGLSYY